MLLLKNDQIKNVITSNNLYIVVKRYFLSK
jgi:hypothetical protein